MLWGTKTPQAGDMLRVKTGSIHHYGVYVGDDRVIQFGLAPVARIGVKDSEIEVCVSSVETFLCGGDLEVATLEEGEKRLPPEKSVALAFARLGEKGYNLFHNNCEHFAYECVTGEKKSTQMDFVRNFFRSMAIVDVYTAQIPAEMPSASLFPVARDEEVRACGNERVRKQKYYVWKLLEYALDRTFGYKIKDLTFTKNVHGKWETPSCYFSLSHSDETVAVAVSRKVVGVDIEPIATDKSTVLEKVLTKDEKAQLSALSADAKTEFLVEKWTGKESVFKTLDLPRFKPEDIQVSGYSTASRRIESGEGYILSVATEDLSSIRYFLDVDLKR